MSSKLAAPRGVALFLVLVQVFILALIVAALGTMALKNLRVTSEKSWQRQARFAAYAGIQASLAQLDEDPNWQPTGWWEQTLGESASLYCSVQVRNNVVNPNGESILAPDNTWIPPETAWIRSRGYLGEVGSYQSSALVALVARARPVFDQAIFAQNQVQILNGSRVNSYDSKLGYDVSLSSETSPRRVSHVGSNSVANATITVSGGSWVDGNVLVGLGGTPGSVFSNLGGSLTGEALRLEEEKPVYRFRSSVAGLPTQPLQIPRPTPLNEYNFPWEVPNETGDQPRQAAFSSMQIRANNPDWDRATNLFAGEYYVAGNLDFRSDPDFLNAPTQIRVHANEEFPVVIYVEGNVNLDNVRVNHVGTPNPSPRRLQIYTLGDTGTFTMNNSELHAVVAGRGLNVNISNNSRLFGAVIGGNVTVNSSEVHYDISLRGVPMNGRTAWDVLAIKEASGSEATQEEGVVALAPPQPPSIAELALDPVQGTRGEDPGNAAIPGRTDIPEEEVLVNPPDPTCGTCLEPLPACVCLCPGGCGEPVLNCACVCPGGCGEPVASCACNCPGGCGEPTSNCQCKCPGCDQFPADCQCDCPGGCGEPVPSCACEPDVCGKDGCTNPVPPDDCPHVTCGISGKTHPPPLCVCEDCQGVGFHEPECGAPPPVCGVGGCQNEMPCPLTTCSDCGVHGQACYCSEDPCPGCGQIVTCLPGCDGINPICNSCGYSHPPPPCAGCLECGYLDGHDPTCSQYRCSLGTLGCFATHPPMECQ